MTGRSVDLRLVPAAAASWLTALVAIQQPQWRPVLLAAGWGISALLLCWVLVSTWPGHRQRAAATTSRLNDVLLVIAVSSAAVGLLAGGVAMHEAGRRPAVVETVADSAVAHDVMVVVTQAVEAGSA